MVAWLTKRRLKPDWIGSSGRSGQAQVRLLIETEANPRPQVTNQKAPLLQGEAADADLTATVAILVERITPALAQLLRGFGLSCFGPYGSCLLRWPGLYIERPAQE